MQNLLLVCEVHLVFDRLMAMMHLSGIFADSNYVAGLIEQFYHRYRAFRSIFVDREKFNAKVYKVSRPTSDVEVTICVESPSRFWLSIIRLKLIVLSEPVIKQSTR
jgi:hypothetical protein